MLAPVLVTPPDDLPLSVAEARQHCRIDGTDDDALVAALIQAATDHLDGWNGILGRCLMTQTWRQDFPGFGCRMRLPLAPVQSVSQVTYYDADNAQQTLASSVYALLTDAVGSYVTLAPNQDWPTTYRRPDAVSVTYVAGYGGATDVPQAIKQAMLLMISHWYENREAATVGVIASSLPMAVDALLTPYRVVAF